MESRFLLKNNTWQIWIWNILLPFWKSKNWTNWIYKLRTHVAINAKIIVCLPLINLIMAKDLFLEIVVKKEVANFRKIKICQIFINISMNDYLAISLWKKQKQNEEPLEFLEFWICTKIIHFGLHFWQIWDFVCLFQKKVIEKPMKKEWNLCLLNRFVIQQSWHMDTSKVWLNKVLKPYFIHAFHIREKNIKWQIIIIIAQL